MGDDVAAFPEAVLFDMDGTLTVPTFDFPALRRAMGLPEGAAILEYMARMAPDERLKAETILHKFEDDVAMTAPLAAGCHDLLGWIARQGSKIALITRNRRESVTTFLKRHALEISVCIARDDAPHKPDPAPLLLAAKRLGVRPERCWMVGDGQFDIEAGNAAGMRSIWLRLNRQRQFAAVPWREIEELCDLRPMLEGVRACNRA